jgi:hypothetical protein
MKPELKALLLTIIIVAIFVTSFLEYGPIGIVYVVFGILALSLTAFIYLTILNILDP